MKDSFKTVDKLEEKLGCSWLGSEDISFYPDKPIVAWSHPCYHYTGAFIYFHKNHGNDLESMIDIACEMSLKFLYDINPLFFYPADQDIDKKDLNIPKKDIEFKNTGLRSIVSFFDAFKDVYAFKELASSDRCNIIIGMSKDKYASRIVPEMIKDIKDKDNLSFFIGYDSKGNINNKNCYVCVPVPKYLKDIDSLKTRQWFNLYAASKEQQRCYLTGSYVSRCIDHTLFNLSHLFKDVSLLYEMMIGERFSHQISAPMIKDDNHIHPSIFSVLENVLEVKGSDEKLKVMFSDPKLNSYLMPVGHDNVYKDHNLCTTMQFQKDLGLDFYPVA